MPKMLNFMKLPSSGSQAVPSDRHTDRRDEAVSRFSQFCKFT